MVVVFCSEEEMIHQSHWLLEARVEFGSSNRRRIQRLRATDQLLACPAELLEDYRDGLGVVVGLVSLAISQVSRRKFVSIGQKVIHAREPQRFEVEQVPGMFLGRPFISGFSDQCFARGTAHEFFQSRRGAAQARTQVGMEFHGERELKFSLEPDADGVHGD